MINKAIKYVKDKHKHQKYGNEPYFYHLQSVVDIIAIYQNLIDPEDRESVIIAGYLHDTIEDTSATYSEIKHLFNKKIADIVYSVTDETGKNRKERKAKTYIKLMDNELGIFIKLADRIANTLDENSSLFSMYRKEYSVFKYFLYSKKYKKMWEALDKKLL